MNLILNLHPNKNRKYNNDISFIPEGIFKQCRLTVILMYQFNKSIAKPKLIIK